MRLIAITSPDFRETETARAGQLLGSGFWRIHLRKPEATAEELRQWLDALPAALHPRVVLHDHYELAREYAVGGIHLNRRHPEVPAGLPTGLTLSCSCHSLREVREKVDGMDYVFLSPIYDSISKQGYRAAFTRQQLEEARREGVLGEKVFALGGVTLDRLDEIGRLGFGGAAMLGAAW